MTNPEIAIFDVEFCHCSNSVGKYSYTNIMCTYAKVLVSFLARCRFIFVLGI